MLDTQHAHSARNVNNTNNTHLRAPCDLPVRTLVGLILALLISLSIVPLADAGTPDVGSTHDFGHRKNTSNTGEEYARIGQHATTSIEGHREQPLELPVRSKREPSELQREPQQFTIEPQQTQQLEQQQSQHHEQPEQGTELETQPRAENPEQPVQSVQTQEEIAMRTYMEDVDIEQRHVLLGQAAGESASFEGIVSRKRTLLILLHRHLSQSPVCRPQHFHTSVVTSFRYFTFWPLRFTTSRYFISPNSMDRHPQFSH